MKSLDELKQQQPQILLAEIAGLLHDIGKLDANFLASVLSTEPAADAQEQTDPKPADLAKAKLEIEQHLQLIKTYSLKRFSSPNLTLLSEDVKRIVTSQSWLARKDLAAALKNQFSEASDLIAIDELVRDWDKAKVQHPWIARLLDAIWYFNSWSGRNGPLYLCRDLERQSLKAIRGELDELDVEYGQVKKAFVTAPDDQRKALGLREKELKRKRTEKKDELDSLSSAIYDLERSDQAQLEAKLGLSLSIANETRLLADLLTLFWDTPFFFKPEGIDYQRQSALKMWLRNDRGVGLPGLLALAHGEVSGSEKSPLTTYVSPKWDGIRAATAFGYEPVTLDKWELQAKRHNLISLLLSACSPIANLAEKKKRKDFLARAKLILESGLGDTQWPINEINLWDYASTIATLFKASVAKAVLEDRVPTVPEVKWRLLSIRYDGLEYLSRAHHISDLLARREALEAALDEVKAVIEVEYPLGNEIYRDENGSVLLVPNVEDGDQEIILLEQTCGTGSERKSLKQLLNDRFSTARYDEAQEREPLGGEVQPAIGLSGPYLGKDIDLPNARCWKNPVLQPDPAKVSDWWGDKKKRGEVCTVCGLRPQGYGAPDDVHDNGKKGWNLHIAEQHQQKHHSELDPEACEVCKAQTRQICWVCMERRDERSRKWVESALTRTIWTDEVADEDGRLVLVVARFVLDQWLDRTLIPTMQKRVTFARIQRCWRTTLEFWQEVERGKQGGKNEEGLPEWILCDRTRLSLTPEGTNLDLGRYHVYDLEIGGHLLSVVWTGKHFLSADNLEYFNKTGGDVDNLDGKTVDIYEPSAHLSRRKRKASVTIRTRPHKETYSPFIPILAQPSLFMALIPAKQALEVAQRIKEKYEKQMGKVRDRLPLHIGLVFAPRRTPVRALLEAGRRMLKMPEKWESVNVQHIDHDAKDHKVTFTNGAVWAIPAVMGDGTTPDQWYPHLLRREPMAGEDLSESKPWDHAKDLQVSQSVWVRPSRFDFEFLDTAARRFEISYDGNGNRRGSATRPFLLEDLSKLDELWDLLVGLESTGKKKLSTSHLQHLESSLTSYITDWFNGDVARAAQCRTYQTFATDTLHQLDTKWWKEISKDEKKKYILDDAVKSGLILDLLDLRMHILKEKSGGATKGENS